MFIIGAPVVLVIVAVVVDAMIGVPVLTIVAVLILLALLVPSLAVTVRRLHDTGRSAWWLLIDLVPFGGLYLLYLYVQPSSSEANGYGLPPGA